MKLHTEGNAIVPLDIATKVWYNGYIVCSVYNRLQWL